MIYTILSWHSMCGCKITSQYQQILVKSRPSTSGLLRCVREWYKFSISPELTAVSVHIWLISLTKKAEICLRHNKYVWDWSAIMISHKKLKSVGCFRQDPRPNERDGFRYIWDVGTSKPAPCEQLTVADWTPAPTVRMTLPGRSTAGWGMRAMFVKMLRNEIALCESCSGPRLNNRRMSPNCNWISCRDYSPISHSINICISPNITSR